jgi:tRNA pseudouridine55 synthase
MTVWLPEFEDKILLIDKPKLFTSFDIVNKVRKFTGIKKIGHAGTLDPIATGLLVLCTGKKTRQVEQIQAVEKEYLFTMCLGAVTKTYDAEQPPYNFCDAGKITLDHINAILPRFIGSIEQIPPPYSALKINGKRAYALARKGIPVTLSPRTITIYELEIFDFQGPTAVSGRVCCSKGTYIRSLVHDIGQLLGVGAYLTALRRTRIGNYHVTDALTIAFFEALRQQ